MAKLNFNAAKEEGMDDYSVVPADHYNVQIVKSEVADTKAKKEAKAQNKNIEGSLLKLQFKIIDGKFKGRIIFGQYNIANPNAQCVEISKKQMKTLCDAIGKPNGVEDSNEMHNIPLQIKVSVKPAQGVYAEQNEIKFYAKYEGPKVAGAGTVASKNPAKNPAKTEDTNTETVDEVEEEIEAEETPAATKKAPWAE